MRNLMDIVHMLDTRVVSNEKYYKLKDLNNALNAISDRFIEVDDNVITPYYVSAGKRLELYEYELKIWNDSQEGFEEYILKLTGKKNLNDVPNEVMQRQKRCMVAYDNNSQKLRISRLKKYLCFLLRDEELKKQVESSFGAFDEDNLYFDVY